MSPSRSRAAVGALFAGMAVVTLLDARGGQPPPDVTLPVVLPVTTPTVKRQMDGPAAGALSPRNASYDLDVRLDHARRTLHGEGVIRWRNIGLAPADSLRLHLYWNGWRNTASSWMRQRQLAGASSAGRGAEDWSFIDLTTLALAAADGGADVDLLPALNFVQPDDGNVDDRTLAAVPLPAPVAPGGEIAVRIAWMARVPRTFARTGVVGDFYFIAHWFPKVGVFEEDRWHAHQFHANTEFFADYGRYDVRITVPRGWVVGATGREQSRVDGEDDTTTHYYVQDDVHDFAWTTSPHYVEHRDTFRHGSLPPVEMRLLMQPEHAGQEDRHFSATAAALRYYGEWYGPYPYGHVTIVDPAYRSGAAGMEYPTIFTAGTRWWAPRGTNEPEAVTVHEAGHQFWHGIVGNNEVRDAWMDEGLNMFSEARVLEIAFQPDYLLTRFFGGFVPWQFRDIPLQRATDGNGLNGYRRAATRDVPMTPTWQYWPGTHAQITYFKTALWLHMLERHLGWDTLQRILATFFERWAFRHPRPEDFFALANEVSGEDLTWFFDQVYRSANVFDYGVERFDSVPLQVHGLAAPGSEANATDDEAADATAARRDEALYRTSVVVRRFGEAIFPVDVLITFADGHTVRERWDGLDRWTDYTIDHPARARTVQVDPERVLLLDVNYTNNTRTLEPRGADAAAKWSLKWMVWLQDLLLTVG